MPGVTTHETSIRSRASSAAPLDGVPSASMATSQESRSGDLDRESKELYSGENLRMAIVNGLMLCKGQRIDRDH